MQIKRTSKDGKLEFVGLEDFEKNITGRFVFLKLGQHSIRIESHMEAVEFLKDGFTLATTDCDYRKIRKNKRSKKQFRKF